MARALVRRALQRRNFCKSCPPACYQRRAGLWFSRSRNPALTAGLFFDKQDASIRGCQHPRLLERKEVVRPHPSSRPGRVRGGRGVLFQEAFQRSDKPAGAAAGKAARSARRQEGVKPGPSPIPHATDSTSPSLQASETAWPRSMGAGWSFETKLLKLEGACKSPRALVKIRTLISQVWAGA